MNEFNTPPRAISHKQLNSLLSSAQKDSQSFSDLPEDAAIKNQSFNELLDKWSEISKELLKVLNKKEASLTEGKNPKSLMALGALEAHLNLAMQARKASELDK